MQATTVSNKIDSNRLPFFLPDGRHVLFSFESGNAVGKVANGYGIFVLDRETKKVQQLLQEASNAAYAPPGYLLFYRGGNLMAQPFDSANLRVSGAAIPVAEEVSYNADRWTAQFSVSQSGLLVYLKGSFVPMAQLTWFSLDGKKLGTVGEPKGYFDAAISPSGDRALVTLLGENGTPGLWMLDLSRGVLSLFDPTRAGANTGVWSPNGREVLFNDDGGVLFEKSADGGSSSRQISPGTDMLWVQAWSPDGRSVLWGAQTGIGTWQMGVLPMTGDGKPSPYLPSPARETEPSFSPDGHWVSFFFGRNRLRRIVRGGFSRARRKMASVFGRSDRWRLVENGQQTSVRHSADEAHGSGRDSSWERTSVREGARDFWWTDFAGILERVSHAQLDCTGRKTIAAACARGPIRSGRHFGCVQLAGAGEEATVRDRRQMRC